MSDKKWLEDTRIHLGNIRANQEFDRGQWESIREGLEKDNKRLRAALEEIDGRIVERLDKHMVLQGDGGLWYDKTRMIINEALNPTQDT